MRQWGDRWAAPGGAPMAIRHRRCGRLVRAVPACSQCGERLELLQIGAVPGPGARKGDFDRTRVPPA